MKEYVKDRIQTAVSELFGLDPEEISFRVERPKDVKWGDVSSNVVFILAKKLDRNPKDVGDLLINKLSEDDNFSRVSFDKGFLNFNFNRYYILKEFFKLLVEGEEYFRKNIGEGKKVQVEFVSANPTGPLHLGHGRGAVVGNAICNLLEFFGFSVTREYYVNDAGNQVYMLGKSIYARYMELLGKYYPFPEEGYKGEYIKDLARSIYEERGDMLANLSEEEAIDYCVEYGLFSMLNDIREDLDRLGIRFDVWYSERSLYEKGLVEEIIGKLRDKGLVYEKEGALWFKSSEFGDDKDRVLKKSDGSYTYFASDIAYHYEKYSRGFEKVINLWGADHHGYEARIRSALKALCIGDDWLDIYFVQMVKLFKGKEEIRMSKRTGEFVTLRELIDEIGEDAVKFMFLTKRSDTPLSIDIEIVKQKTSENPVFYVQYAHARACGIEREVMKRFGNKFKIEEEDVKRYIEYLNLPEEENLIKKLLMFKEDLWESALHREPHTITYLLQEIAGDFHHYYNHHRVITDDINISMGRLLLVRGVKTVIALGLKLIGVTSPERM